MTSKGCHIPGCDRDALPNLLVCGPCRLAYLNGVRDEAVGKAGVKTDLCPACGHFPHDDVPNEPCGWHGGNCDEAIADPTLWCRCDTKHPQGNPTVPRPKCWWRVADEDETRRNGNLR